MPVADGHVVSYVMPNRRILTWFVLLRVTYGSIFVMSGVLKLIDLPSFAIALSSFRVVPPSLVSYVEYVIPTAEVLLGSCLICGFRTAVVSFLIACLVAVFSGLIAEKLIEGAQINCGCFGSIGGETLTGLSLVRNVVLSVWGALLVSLSVGVRRQNPHEEGRTETTFDASNADSTIALGTVTQRVGVYCIAFLLLGLSSLLGFQNVALKNRLAMVVDQQLLRPGETVPGFWATGLDGSQIHIRYDNTSKRTMLLMFSTDCNACKDNLANWDEIAKSVRDHQGWRIIGVSMSALENSRKFSESRALGYPVLVVSDLSFRRDYKISLTPQTVVVDSIGRVDAVWTGILSPEGKAEVIQIIKSSPAMRQSSHEASGFMDNPAELSKRIP